MALPSANSLVPLTSYWSLNEIIIQNMHSITYCLWAMWARLRTSALSLTCCFSCCHLANKWWYNSHTFCWPSDKMRLVWSRSAVSLLTSCEHLANMWWMILTTQLTAWGLAWHEISLHCPTEWTSLWLTLYLFMRYYLTEHVLSYPLAINWWGQFGIKYAILITHKLLFSWIGILGVWTTMVSHTHCCIRH